MRVASIDAPPSSAHPCGPDSIDDLTELPLFQTATPTDVSQVSIDILRSLVGQFSTTKRFDILLSAHHEPPIERWFNAGFVEFPDISVPEGTYLVACR
ncbi:MAG: hypothetical protein PHT19_16425 [Methylococcus sp.]|nr:hypothetical protein [Methylococcus sp.]